MTRRPRVFVTRPIIDGPLDSLRDIARVTVNPQDRALAPEELYASIRSVDAILSHLTDDIDARLLEMAGPDLKIVANYAAGYNNIDVPACTRHRVYATHTPDVLTESTADLAWTLLMAVARRVVEGDRLVRSGRFTGWAPQLLLGREVSGKTLGIIGCGRIGRAVARRGAAFGMQVIYHQHHRLAPDIEKNLNLRYVALGELLGQAEFISLHCPLTEQTRHLIDKKALELMKPEAILINTARGPIIDEKALVRFLQNQKISGAGLDVFEDEPRLAAGLSELDNVVVLPHIGSATAETRRRMGEVAAANIRAALEGSVPPNALNADQLAG